MRVVFVGEAPNRARPSGKKFPALWPFVPGSGARLAKYLGLSPKEFWRQGWTLVNLFDKPVVVWDPNEASLEATFICVQYLYMQRWVLVMLGKKVAKAFNDVRPYFEPRVDCDGNVAIVVPHPSGRCRAWNDSRNVARFRKVMREMGVIE